MRFWMLAFGVAVLFGSRIGAAQTQRDDEPRSAPANSSAPEQHFEHALEYYRGGRYRAAIQELNAAIVLDPDSKDLFYNLALVYEKLGQLDRAIVALGRYIELERDPAEAKRAGLTIARLQGAKDEFSVPNVPIRAPEPPGRPLTPPTPPQAPPRDGRADDWILGGTALTATAALVGILFGVRALALEPGSSEGSRAERRRKAEDSARIADIALSAGFLAGAGTALLWFTRAGEACPGTATGVGVSYQGAF